MGQWIGAGWGLSSPFGQNDWVNGLMGWGRPSLSGQNDLVNGLGPHVSIWPERLSQSTELFRNRHGISKQTRMHQNRRTPCVQHQKQTNMQFGTGDKYLYLPIHVFLYVYLYPCLYIHIYIFMQI